MDDLGPLADPLLRRMFPSWTRYRSFAQAWAVQLLRTAPPGAVVLAAMATGGGKTLTYVLPLLEEREIHSRSGALVVVPTISLAVDQVDALSRRYPIEGRSIRATEVHSALGGLERDKREQGFVRGDYDVLLTSPERALNPEFIERMRSMGQDLRFLVIDEVHAMCDWGETFRLEYPRLGWLRRELLRSSPELRTHLMSATIPKRVEKQLKTIIGVDDSLWRTVRGSSLRFEAEIEIQALNVYSHHRSLRWLRDHVASLPTPGLIYVTRPIHAEEIGSALRTDGYRCEVYHGNTDEETRQRIAREWVDGDINFVVGTSAFGLGIDKPNVRSVTHLCIPESLDRYYQEMGRAGRDGQRCLASLVTVDEDLGIAQANTKRLLTPEKFDARWEDLVNNGECLADTGDEMYWLIDESQRPRYAPADGWYMSGSPSDLHVFWNRSLLNFLQRLGLVRYEGPYLTEVKGLASEKTLSLLFSHGWQQGRWSEVDVGQEIRVNHHRAPGLDWAITRAQMLQVWRTISSPSAVWRSVYRVERLAVDQTEDSARKFKAIVAERREDELQASFRATNEMIKYARGKPTGCYRRPIAELYGERLDTCGNCGWCLAHGFERSVARTPPKPPAWGGLSGNVSRRVKEWLRGTGMLLVAYSPPPPDDLCQRLERGGFRQFVVSTAITPPRGIVHFVEKFRPERVIFERLPSAVVIPGQIDTLTLQRLLSFLDLQQSAFSEEQPCVVFLPDSLHWATRSVYVDKFPGQRVSLETLRSTLPGL